MDYIQNLKSATQWIAIIMGCSLLVLGIIEALLNLVIFSRVRFRKTAYSQYIFVGSLIDLCLISVNLTSRISVDGFGTSTFYSVGFVCKLRNYFGQCFLVSCIWCKCLAAFDRWAATSRNVTIHQWTNVKQAQILLLTINILSGLISSPNILLSYPIKINNIWLCIMTDKTYLDYYAYFFNTIEIFLLPLFMLSYFGLRTHDRLSHLNIFRRGQVLERQFTRMILYQVFITIISSLPYGLQSSYIALTFT